MKKLAVLLLTNLLIFVTAINGISCDSSDGNENGTSDTTVPIITGSTISGITETTATISWTTDEPTASNIEYGPTTSYGYSFPSPSDAIADKTSHSLTLSDLSPDTTYHFQVKSTDASGNETVSGDQTFTTYSLTVIDLGKIVFSSARDGNPQIYIMDADGTNQTRLTNNSATDGNPKLSADGQKVVFDSNRDGNQEIYAMNADGTDQTRITNNTFVDIQPEWSPDGTRIAFSSMRSGTPQIWVMNADGSDPVQLTFDPHPDIPMNSVRCYAPAWSYDGTRITFSSIIFTNLEGIWVMNADGSNLDQIASTGMIDTISDPAWSPDNMKIAVSRSPIGGQGDQGRIMIMDSSGNNGVSISGDNFDFAPSYSPDGSKIVFYSRRDGNNEIYIMNVDGSNETRLTTNAADDSFPSWGPTAENGTDDTTSPAAALSGQPTGTVSYSTADIIIAGSNVVSYKYKLDGGTLSDEMPASTHITLSDLADGLHTISVVGRDAAGNWQAEALSTTASWTVDTTLATPVVFPDAKLEEYIRAAIGKAQGDIYQADLAGLTSFNIGSMMQRGVTDLTGLEYCTSLTWLNLRYNQISDLSPLSSLTSLTYLDLIGNQKISDISPLSSLISLTKLFLEDNQISDISLLSSLTSLTELYLGGNQISDISSLSSLTRLHWLWLDNNQISNIETLVSNSGLGQGDLISLTDNPLSATSVNTYIPTLEARGVSIEY